MFKYNSKTQPKQRFLHVNTTLFMMASLVSNPSQYNFQLLDIRLFA